MYPIRIIEKTTATVAHSALPDAPVVAESSRRQPVRATRAALSAGLHAAARVVEPPRREVCA